MENAERKFRKFDQHMERSVSLYRSSNPKLTSIYFTNDDDKKSKEAVFEFLYFEYTYDKNQCFIKYPNTDYFVELVGGSNGGRGTMTHGIAENIWADKFRCNINMHIHDTHALLTFDRSRSEFNFLELVARRDVSDRYRESHIKELNKQEIFDLYKTEYLGLPMNIREFSYLKKSNDFIPYYIIVDFPKFNFGYNTQRFRILRNNEIEEYTIKNFERYRDGGTTYIYVIGKDGKEHKFYSPTPFKKDEKSTFDEQELQDVTEEETQELIRILNIDYDIREKLE